MSTFPYTHPSMPGTSYREYLTPLPREMEAHGCFAAQDEEPPVALPPATVTESVMDAALNDAEGRRLVEDILRRKRLEQLWGYYATFHPAYDPFKATREKLAELSAETGKAVQYVQRLNGPSSLQVWVDEIQQWRDAYAPSEYSGMFTAEARLMTHGTGWRYSMLIGGRGHGKRTAQIEALRKWNSRPAASIPHKAPGIAGVRWICAKPTDPFPPVYAPGSYGWMMEQYEARLTPAIREHNRKIREENAALMAEFADLLGVKPHGTDD